MLFLHTECPHCLEKSGFHIFANSEYTTRLSGPQLEALQNRPYIGDRPDAREPVSLSLVGLCINCHRPAIFEVRIAAGWLREMLRNISDRERRYDEPEPEIVQTWPEKKRHYEHPALPKKVNELFLDLQAMIDEKKNPSLIVAGCRAVLEESVKELGGEGKGLVYRIEDLKHKAILSGVLAEWAHEVRIEGNEAIHELSATEDEAAELVEYVRFFLQYAFEFPARIAEKRGKR